MSERQCLTSPRQGDITLPADQPGHLGPPVTQVHVPPTHTEARQTERWSLERRDVYHRVMQGMGGSGPKEPPAPQGFQKSIFKSQ